MLSPEPYSMLKNAQKLKDSQSEVKYDTIPDAQEQQGSDTTTPIKSPGGLQDQSPKTPSSPSALRKPSSAGARRKSVTFSSTLDTFPSPPIARISHHFSEFEERLSATKASDMSDIVTESSSSDRRSLDGSMSPPSTTFKVREEVIKSDVPIITASPNSALFRQPSDAVRPPSASDHYHSRRTSTSSRAASSESKPVSKVKALAQAFNSLTASKDSSVKGRASSNGHKKSDSWTQKIRRSLSGGSSKKAAKELKVAYEEVEHVSPVKETCSAEEVGITTEGVQLANSPAGSPSMELTETPFVFPAVPSSQRLDKGSDSRFNDENHVFPGTQHNSFLAPQLNRKSSSIYSRSENGGSPQQQANSMMGSSPQTTFKNGSSFYKQPALELYPSPNPNYESLHVQKRTPNTDSPGKKTPSHKHKRSNAAIVTPTTSRTPSGVDYSAYLAPTPSTAATQRTHTPAGIPHAAYLAEDYTEYLDANFPRDVAPPPPPPRNPDRLTRPPRRPPVSPRLPPPVPPRQTSAYDTIPASQRGVVPQAMSAYDTIPASQYGIVPQELTVDDEIKARAHIEGANSAALARLKREAMYPGRLNERAADGLVGKEMFAGEDRGDDSVMF